ENALLLQTIDVTARVEEERRLHQTQKLEAIGTLVSGVAHDFNNLLTAIGGSLELASRELQPSEWLDRARLATDSASDRVRQLLQFSKRQPVRPAIVDLGLLATETVDLVRQTTDGRVMFDVAPSSGVNVWADRKQTQQALMNLLVNARDAVLERLASVDGTDVPYQPCVDVAVSRSSQDEGWGELTVSDNGVGMPDDVLECIFDPFFTTKEADGGAGLGMSIVFAIVTDHDGTVTVDSAPDRGTTVRIQLPVPVAAAVAADGEGDGAPATSAQPPHPRKQGTILVVDDEPIISEFAQSVLTRAGYDVVSTTNGDEALIELLRRPYDLLLLDVNMPAPNGWQVLHEALTLNPEQCVMMLSGFALEEEAKERGAVGLIQKPFSGSTLIEQVTGTLRDRSSAERTAVEV
ncbi:MAG: ATP-binding protein, partial [Dehalococcoidia bacterium]